MEPTWSKMVAPIKDFFHPNHLIVKIPAFYMALYHEIQIQVLVRSSGKNSEPVSFTYTPCQDRDMSCSLSPVSPVCPPSDKISVIRSVRSVQPATSKLTILQPLDTNDNKRARVDWSQRRHSRHGHSHHSSVHTCNTICMGVNGWKFPCFSIDLDLRNCLFCWIWSPWLSNLHIRKKK